MFLLGTERLAQSIISLLTLISQSRSAPFLVLYIYACIFFAVADTPRTGAIGYLQGRVSQLNNIRAIPKKDFNMRGHGRAKFLNGWSLSQIVEHDSNREHNALGPDSFSFTRSVASSPFRVVEGSRSQIWHIPACEIPAGQPG